MKYPIFFSSPRRRPRRAPMKRPARAGDGRAEHPFASASTLPMHEFMPDPHGLRCAVQAGCNSCLVSRGDAPVGPVGPDAPPSPFRTVFALGAELRKSMFSTKVMIWP